jgi:hypothetical protein
MRLNPVPNPKPTSSLVFYFTVEIEMAREKRREERNITQKRGEKNKQII